MSKVSKNIKILLQMSRHIMSVWSVNRNHRYLQTTSIIMQRDVISLKYVIHALHRRHICTRQN
jgi:RNase P subunit RPR2